MREAPDPGRGTAPPEPAGGRPRLALTVGDPAGIGGEIVQRALASSEVRAELALVVLGPRAFRPHDIALVREQDLAQRADGAVWVDTSVTDVPAWTPGRPDAASGREALAALACGARLARTGVVDALVTAPVSKEALHLAGERVEGQTELLGRWENEAARGERPQVQVEMLAVTGDLRILLLTRHRPLKQALEAIRCSAVVAHLELLARGLAQLGFERPRLALAGLNPHASEGGRFGDEEALELEPAVERARAAGLDVTGPVSPDAVFVRALDGEFDGVLALYHDQAFIPIKLLGRERGLTVLLGLPYLRVSPAHGTACDLVGTGRADATPLIHALVQAARWSQSFAPRSSASK